MANKEKKKQDTLLKACLKTFVLLVLLSMIGFVVSYALVEIVEKILKVNNNYTVFELMYTEGKTAKYFSSTNIKVIIQTMVYMLTIFALFLGCLIFYFKKYILSKRDSIFYSLFIIIMLYLSSFILIWIGIRNINEVINNFNDVVLTYNINTFENFLKKLSNLRILVTVLYAVGATITCLFALFVIRNGNDETKEVKTEVKEEKEVVAKLVAEVDEGAVTAKVDDGIIRSNLLSDNAPSKEDVPKEVEVPVKKDNNLGNTANINIANELDAEEKRIFSEINGMINEFNSNRENMNEIIKINNKKNVNKRNNNVKK